MSDMRDSTKPLLQRSPTAEVTSNPLLSRWSAISEDAKLARRDFQSLPDISQRGDSAGDELKATPRRKMDTQTPAQSNSKVLPHIK